MADEKNPFEAVQAMMLENLERVQGATQSYIDMVEKAMRGIPGADEDRIATFKAYVERRVAANHDFAEKLLRAKDFQEALRIQVEILSVSTEGRRARRKQDRHPSSGLFQPSNNRVSVGAFCQSSLPRRTIAGSKSRTATTRRCIKAAESIQCVDRKK
jgi:hypothetical protein